jgi:hypothetical protein
MPFLAGEGMAFDWLGDYAAFANVVIGVNAPRMLEEIRFFLLTKYSWTEEEVNRRVVYLPNYYPVSTFKFKEYSPETGYIDIGCFGAVRPLKNHMLQAIASLQLAESLGLKLRFHINGGRLEMKGEPVISNLRSLFAHLSDKGHTLVNHQWTPREEFLLLCGKMDIGMQVSFSETFNIVGADFVSQGVPLLGSSEIPWASIEFNSAPTNSAEIFEKLLHTHHHPERNVVKHQALLARYVMETKRIWTNYFKD